MSTPEINDPSVSELIDGVGELFNGIKTTIELLEKYLPTHLLNKTKEGYDALSDEADGLIAACDALYDLVELCAPEGSNDVVEVKSVEKPKAAPRKRKAVDPDVPKKPRAPRKPTDPNAPKVKRVRKPKVAVLVEDNSGVVLVGSDSNSSSEASDPLPTLNGEVDLR
jgi:hypothetical protein